MSREIRMIEEAARRPALSVRWTIVLPFLYAILIATLNGSDWAGMLRALSFVGAAIPLILVHEYGHAAAARAFGVPVRLITLSGAGGTAFMDHSGRGWRARAGIAAAGPAANAILFLPAALLFALPGVRESGPALEALRIFAIVNGAIMIFSLLPLYPMDGGRIIQGLIMRGTSERRATLATAAICLIFGQVTFFTLTDLGEHFYAIICMGAMTMSLGFTAMEIKSTSRK